jgi:hypothetical protein
VTLKELIVVTGTTGRVKGIGARGPVRYSLPFACLSDSALGYRSAVDFEGGCDAHLCLNEGITLSDF